MWEPNVSLPYGHLQPVKEIALHFYKVTSRTDMAVESVVIKPIHLGKKKLEWSQDIAAVVRLALLLDDEDTMEPRALPKVIRIFTQAKVLLQICAHMCMHTHFQYSRLHCGYVNQFSPVEKFSFSLLYFMFYNSN